MAEEKVSQMLNVKSPSLVTKDSDGLTKAVESRMLHKETYEEAWIRIFAMKNSPTDVERLLEVKDAMDDGRIKRHSEATKKKFSKSEALKTLWVEMKQREAEERLQEMVDNIPSNYHLVDSERKLDRVIEILSSEDEIVFDVETTGVDVWTDYIVGHVLTAIKHDLHFYIPTRHKVDDFQLDNEYVNDKLRPIYEDESIGKLAHNASFDIHMLDREGITLKGLTWDTLEAMKLLNENERSFKLKPLVTKYLKIDSLTYGELFGKKGFDEVPLDQALAYAAKDGDVTRKLRDFQRTHLQKIPKMYDYYVNVEVPLIPIVVELEKTGYVIDLDIAESYKEELRIEAKESEAKVREVFGDINLDSPKQLKQAIEEYIGEPIENTNAKTTLKPLSHKYPIIKELLHYRGLNKLLSTYIETMPNHIKEKTGRLHTQYNPNGAVTGRFSSGGGGVNLQNQPKAARKLFIAPEGQVLMGGDFSQQEYRCLTYFSQDESLVRNYQEGRDLYSEVASDVFKKPIEECGDGSSYRSHAKVLLLAVAYGGGANMLKDAIGITKKEAQRFLDEFFTKYPAVDEWIKSNQDFVREHGFVWMDKERRKRRLPDAKVRHAKKYYSSVFTQSTNARVQGSAAIQTKETMIELHKLCQRKTAEGKGEWRLWAVVHDEVILVVPETIDEQDIKDFEHVMLHSYVFGNIPNKCDIELQRRWGTSISAKEFIEGKEIPQL